jgi:hypothetical protein
VLVPLAPRIQCARRAEHAGISGVLRAFRLTNWKFSGNSWKVHVSLIKITHDTFISATLRSPTDIRAERQWFVRCRGPAGARDKKSIYRYLYF